MMDEHHGLALTFEEALPRNLDPNQYIEPLRLCIENMTGSHDHTAKLENQRQVRLCYSNNALTFFFRL